MSRRLAVVGTVLALVVVTAVGRWAPVSADENDPKPGGGIGGGSVSVSIGIGHPGSGGGGGGSTPLVSSGSVRTRAA